jgi:hypothetical protein
MFGAGRSGQLEGRTSREGRVIYIGIGTVVLIIIIVLVILMLRR